MNIRVVLREGWAWDLLKVHDCWSIYRPDHDMFYVYLRESFRSQYSWLMLEDFGGNNTELVRFSRMIDKSGCYYRYSGNDRSFDQLEDLRSLYVVPSGLEPATRDSAGGWYTIHDEAIPMGWFIP